MDNISVRPRVIFVDGVTTEQAKTLSEQWENLLFFTDPSIDTEIDHGEIYKGGYLYTKVGHIDHNKFSLQNVNWKSVSLERVNSTEDSEQHTHNLQLRVTYISCLDTYALGSAMKLQLNQGELFGSVNWYFRCADGTTNHIGSCVGGGSVTFTMNTGLWAANGYGDITFIAVVNLRDAQNTITVTKVVPVDKVNAVPSSWYIEDINGNRLRGNDTLYIRENDSVRLTVGNNLGIDVTGYTWIVSGSSDPLPFVVDGNDMIFGVNDGIGELTLNYGGENVLTVTVNVLKVGKNVALFNVQYITGTIGITTPFISYINYYSNSSVQVPFTVSNGEFSGMVSNAEVTSLNGLFNVALEIDYNQDAFNHITSITSLGSVDNVTDISSAFYGCSALESFADEISFTDKLTNMSNAFYGCSSLKHLDISNWDTSLVSNWGGAFANSGLTEMDFTNNDIGGFKADLSLGEYTSMHNAVFMDCTSLKTVTYGNMKYLKNCRTTTSMFKNCTALETIDTVNLKTDSSLKNVSGMFQNCKRLKSLNLSNMDVSGVTDMRNMFNGCTNLRTLVLRGWKVKNDANCEGFLKLGKETPNTPYGAYAPTVNMLLIHIGSADTELKSWLYERIAESDCPSMIRIVVTDPMDIVPSTDVFTSVDVVNLVDNSSTTQVGVQTGTAVYGGNETGGNTGNNSGNNSGNNNGGNNSGNNNGNNNGSGGEPTNTDPTNDDENVFTVNGVSFRMIPVEGGTFTMGSPTTQVGSSTNERPQHQVTVNSYKIGETQVTQELWKAVMGSNPSQFQSSLQNPVEYVSWSDCDSFIKKLNTLTGKQFRMPTEAEWEFAARGGNNSNGYIFAGSGTAADVAWYKTNSNGQTHPVKSLQPNELGLYDMSGNVNEWVSDWYAAYSADAQTNPAGPATGSYKIYRGGDYTNVAANCRVAYRYMIVNVTAKRQFIGMRLAL